MSLPFAFPAGSLNIHDGLLDAAGLPRKTLGKAERKRRYYWPAWTDLPAEIRDYYEQSPDTRTMCQIISLERLEFDALDKAMQRRVVEDGANGEVIVVHRSTIRQPDYWALRSVGWGKKEYKQIRPVV